MPGWTLRAVDSDDREFLYRVYAGTRAEELGRLGWDAAQQESFLRMQLRAQDQHFRREFPAAQHAVVQLDGVDVGRLVVDRRDGEIGIIDIALLPGQRGAGLGSALLRSVMDEAAATSRRVSLHVACDNPALALYRKLGFAEIEERSAYKLMHWHPPGGSTPRPSPRTAAASLAA